MSKRKKSKITDFKEAMLQDMLDKVAERDEKIKKEGKNSFKRPIFE